MRERVEDVSRESRTPTAATVSPGTRERVLALQRTIGNHAVCALLQRQGHGAPVERPVDAPAGPEPGPQQVRQPLSDPSPYFYETPLAENHLVSRFVAAGSTHVGLTRPVINGRECLGPVGGREQVQAIRNALHAPQMEQTGPPEHRRYRVVGPRRNVASAVMTVPPASLSSTAEVAVDRLRQTLVAQIGQEQAARVLPQLPPRGDVTVTVRDVGGVLRARTVEHEQLHVGDVRRDFSARMRAFDAAIDELSGRWFPTRSELNRAIIERAGLDLPMLEGEDPLDRLALALHHDFQLAGEGRDLTRATENLVGEGGIRTETRYDPQRRHLTIDVRDVPPAPRP